MPFDAYLKKLIYQQGPISIARFMSEALMHPQYGYYQKQQPFGREGDFTTAPEISQMFGEMVGIWVASIWQQMGEPQQVGLVEIGPGRGTLMKDLLRSSKNISGFHEALHVHLVEQSVQLTQAQQEVLKDAHPDISWHQEFGEIKDGPAIVVANELFDALPIYQYVKTTEGFKEKVVALDEEKLVFALAPMEEQLPDEVLPEGTVVEVSPASIGLMQQIAARIKAHGGAGLFIDYGYEMPAYGDTLQALKKHQYHPVLEDVGEADLTAHVNFTALAQAAKAEGLQAEIMEQRRFLEQMGIAVRAEMLAQKATAEQQDGIQSALKRLTGKDEMGRLFKVLMVG